MPPEDTRRKEPVLGLLRSHFPDFAVLASFAVAWNAVLLFDRETIVGHDTFHNYTLFHIFYSHLAEHGALPLWLPYCNKGYSSLLWQISFLSPSNAGTMLPGLLLGISDTSLLHKLSLMHEVLVYLAGVFLCSTRMFASRRTRFLVCVLALGTVAWNEQVYFCLRIVYLLPMILWCLLRFSDTERPAWLWAAACCSIVECLGGPPYFAGLQLLALAACGLPLIVAKPHLWRRILEPSLSNVLGAVLFAGLFLAVDRAAEFAVSDVTLVQHMRGRDGRVRLRTFLTWGDFDRGVSLRSYLPGFQHLVETREPKEPNLYAGAAAVVLCACAWWARNRPEACAVVLPALTMFAFAFSDVFASAAFWFPLMEYYRGRTHVLSVATLFVVLWSGWGLEGLFRSAPDRQARLAAAGLVAAVVLALPVHPETTPARMTLLASAVVGGATLLVGARRVSHARLEACVFGFVLVLVSWDLTLHQQQLQATIRRRDPAQAALFRTRPVRYFPQRQNAKTTVAHSGGPYVPQYQFEGVDPCRAKAGREAVDSEVRDIMTDETLDADAKAAVIGCERPKLVFTDAVAVVPPHRRDDVVGILDEHRGERFVVESADGFRDFVPGSDFLAPLPSEFTLNRLRCGFEAPRDGFLFYSDSFHPDWHATLDGEPVEILVGNGAFKAVFVPAGRHEVVFEFGGTSALYARTIFGIYLASFWILSVPIVVCLVRPPSMRGGESLSETAPTPAAPRPANDAAAEDTGPHDAEGRENLPIKAAREPQWNPGTVPAT